MVGCSMDGNISSKALGEGFASPTRLLNTPSRVLTNARKNGSFKGVKIGGSFYLSHLLFVDNILIFHDGSRRDVKKLKEILELYCVATRMLVNVGNLPSLL